MHAALDARELTVLLIMPLGGGVRVSYGVERRARGSWRSLCRRVDVEEFSRLVWRYQGLAGLDYQMSTHWDLFLNYRYLWADQPNGFLDIDTFSLTKHSSDPSGETS